MKWNQMGTRKETERERLFYYYCDNSIILVIRDIRLPATKDENKTTVSFSSSSSLFTINIVLKWKEVNVF